MHYKKTCLELPSGKTIQQKITGFLKEIEQEFGDMIDDTNCERVTPKEAISYLENELKKRIAYMVDRADLIIVNQTGAYHRGGKI